MSAVTALTIRVRIAELARAIDSVVVHAEKQKQGDEQPLMCRVRFIAREGELLIGATDGRTSALAAVPILSDSRPMPIPDDDGPFVVDVYPVHARSLAGFLSPTKVDGELIGECDLGLSLDEVTVSDVSGKYPGASATVTPIEDEATGTLDGTDHLGFPDLVRTIGAALAAAAGVFKPLAPTPGLLGRFEVAAKSYDVEPVFEPVGEAGARGWVVLIGPRFAGTLESRHGDDDSLRRRDRQRRTHLARLGLLSAAELARLQLGGVEDDDGFFEADDVEDDDDATDRLEARELSLVPSGGES